MKYSVKGIVRGLQNLKMRYRWDKSRLGDSRGSVMKSLM